MRELIIPRFQLFQKHKPQPQQTTRNPFQININKTTRRAPPGLVRKLPTKTNSSKQPPSTLQKSFRSTKRKFAAANTNKSTTTNTTSINPRKKRRMTSRMTTRSIAKANRANTTTNNTDDNHNHNTDNTTENQGSPSRQPRGVGSAAEQEREQQPAIEPPTTEQILQRMGHTPQSLAQAEDSELIGILVQIQRKEELNLVLNELSGPQIMQWIQFKDRRDQQQQEERQKEKEEKEADLKNKIEKLQQQLHDKQARDSAQAVK